MKSNGETSCRNKYMSTHKNGPTSLWAIGFAWSDMKVAQTSQGKGRAKIKKVGAPPPKKKKEKQKLTLRCPIDVRAIRTCHVVCQTCMTEHDQSMIRT